MVLSITIVEKSVVRGSIDDIGDGEKFKCGGGGGGKCAWLSCSFGADEDRNVMDEVFFTVDSL